MVIVGSGTATAPFPFTGIIDRDLSSNVNIMGLPAAIVGSGAQNQDAHKPKPGQSFQNPPTNLGKITKGSQTVRINGEPAARHGDAAETCHDPSPLPGGTVVAGGTVFIG